MRCATSKEHEVYGRMKKLLRERGFERSFKCDDYEIYRHSDLGSVQIRRVPHDIGNPIHADVSWLPPERHSAFNAKGLALLLDDATVQA